MNGLDFFSSPQTTTTTTVEDDDWGDFVDSSPRLTSDRNASNSTPNRIRGPLPLSVFGEEEEEQGDDNESFNFSFDLFSNKLNNGSVNRVANTNDPKVGISSLISNLYRENENGVDLPQKNTNNRSDLETNGNDRESLSSSRNNENLSGNLEALNWNSLNFDTERTSNNVLNSSSVEVVVDRNHSDWGFTDKSDDDWEFTTGEATFQSAGGGYKEQGNGNNGAVVVPSSVEVVVDRDNHLDWGFTDKNDDGDDWEFTTAEATFQSANGGYKEEQGKGRNGAVVGPNVTDLSSSVWSLPTNGTGPSFDNGRVDAVQMENGDDDDPWGSDGWEFKVAEGGEPKNDLTNKESNGWGLGFSFEPVSKVETTNSFQSNFESEPQKRENGSVSFTSDVNGNSEGSSWAFKQPSLETGIKKEEKEVQNKPKGLLPLSFFEDEKLETSDTLVHEENLLSVSDFSVKEKTKAQNPTVSINDLISSLYSQVEEKNAVSLSEKSDSKLVNGEDDSWEFQGSTKTITDPSIPEGDDEFDDTWEFQGPSLALTNSDVAEGVDESWQFQGPTESVSDSTPRKGDNGSWESTHCSVENGVENQFPVPNGFEELDAKTVISIEHKDYQDVFHNLKTELHYIALNHLKTLKEARDLAADSDEVAGVQKCDGEIQDLQKWLNSDVLVSDLENLQPRSSGITELLKALQEPKFRVLAEDVPSERLLLAEKDWKTTVEVLKHVTLTLKILNLGSPEEQSKYTSTWFVIASSCAQELRHAASIWKQVTQNDVQEKILSKPQGPKYALSVGEIYRVVKILRASTRLYRPWILLAPTSRSVLAVLDECVKLWLSSGLEEALLNNFNRHQRLDGDYSADQLLESIKNIDELDASTLHTCITSATSPTCYISGLNTQIVPGIKTVEWNGEHYLVPLANLWANLISRDPPSLPGFNFPTVS